MSKCRLAILVHGSKMKVFISVSFGKVAKMLAPRICMYNMTHSVMFLLQSNAILQDISHSGPIYVLLLTASLKRFVMKGRFSSNKQFAFWPKPVREMARHTFPTMTFDMSS